MQQVPGAAGREHDVCHTPGTASLQSSIAVHKSALELVTGAWAHSRQATTGDEVGS